MGVPVRRRLTKRQQYGIWLQFLAPPDLPRQELEPLVPHLAADGLACALALAASRLGVTLARTAADFVGVEGWKPHGYARLGDFTRERLDRSGRWLCDLATLGAGLGALPGLEPALWGGDGARPLGRVAAVGVARVATAQSVPAWIALARRSTVRRLQQAIRAARHAGSSLPVGDTAADAAPARAIDPASSPQLATPAEPPYAAMDAPAGDPMPLLVGAVAPSPAFDPTAMAPSPASDRSATVLSPVPDAMSKVLSPGSGPKVDPRVVEEEVEDIETFEVRLSVPRAVRAAFEETLDLHRTVSGHQASIGSFVEALAAEAAAGLVPPDASLAPRVAADTARRAEERLARDFRMWASLGIPLFPGIEVARALASRMGGAPVRNDALVPGGELPCDGLATGGTLPREALVAKGPMPFDPTATDTRPEMTAVRALLRRIEALSHQAPRQHTTLQRHTRSQGDATPQPRLASQPEVAAQYGVASQPDASQQRDAAHLAAKLQELVALEDEIERRLGHLLAEMDRRRDWACLRFTSLGHYAEQRLGMCRRTAERRAGILRALRKLPLVFAAYESGVVGLQAAWLLYGILHPGPVDPKLERAWVARAREVTVKRLRDEARWVLLRQHGLLEDEPDDKRNRTNRSPTELDPKRAAKPGDAGPAVPPPPTDAAWHASLRRTPGMSRQRVARLGWQVLQGTSDNVFLRLRLTEDVANSFLASVEGARRHLEDSAGARLNRVAGSAPSVAAARLLLRRREPLPAWVGLLALLEDYVRTWDDPRAQPRRRWSRTYERDSWRCMAPGCTARCWIQDHHIDYRSARGSDELCNQLSLCRFHHLQGEHGSLARCRGQAPLGVIWRLGRRDLGTWYRNERRLPQPTNDSQQEVEAQRGRGGSGSTREEPSAA